MRVWKAASVASLLALLVGLAIGALLLKGSGKVEFPAYHPLTFRRGIVHSARFAPDGKTMIYSAAWEGKPLDLFTTRPESPQSQEMEPKGADVLAISGRAKCCWPCIASRATRFSTREPWRAFRWWAELRAKYLDDVEWADWSPDGANIAVVHEVEGRKRLEFPLGKMVYQSDGWIGNLRVRPDGKVVAFVDHPQLQDDGGLVAVVDMSGKKTMLSDGWDSIPGLGMVGRRQRNLVYRYTHRR